MNRRAQRPAVRAILSLFVVAAVGLPARGQTVLAGVYNGVSIPGDVSINSNTNATFTGGTSFTGTNATFGSGAYLNWNQTGTLSGKAISLATDNTTYINVGSGSLTLGGGTTVTGSVSLWGGSGTTINNQGAITNSGSTGSVYAATFTNSGAITATGGTTFYVGSSGYNTTNTNSGTITADGANTQLYLRGNVTNQGTLTAQNGGALYIQYNTSTGNLGTIQIGTGGGHLYLDSGGTLDNTSATLSAPSGGSWELHGGTISGGAIGAGALIFTGYGGTLSNVSYPGDLNLPASTSVTFSNGTTFTGTNVTLGNAAKLYWNQTGTLSGTTITIPLDATGKTYINVNSGTLTLGNSTTVTGDVYLWSTGATINNQGTISHTAGTGYLYAPTLTNSGTITAGAGTSLYLGSSSYNTTNASGSIITADGANTYLYLRGNVINQGTLAAQNGGALYIGYNNGSISTGNLGTVAIGTGGGHAYLNGTLDNTSATLSAPTGGSYELHGGTINNGTIGAGALTFTGSSGTLSDVSYTGDLSLPASTYVTFTNGTGFTGLNATFGNSAYLYWNQTGTLAGKTITLGTTGDANITVGNNYSLTLSSTTVTGGVYVTGNSGAAIANAGTITHSFGTGYLYAPTLTNSGTITATNGASLAVGSSSTGYSTTNTSTGSMTADGAYLYLDGNVANQGTLTAQHGGALYFRGNNSTGNLGTVAIGTGGGHAYLGGTLTNTEATLSAPSGGSYELRGGTINNGIIGSGALTFTNSGGTLSNVSYTGDLSLPSFAYVTFTNGTSFTGANNATLDNYAKLYWNQTGTLSATALSLGWGAYITVGNNYSLTLGSGTVVTGDAYLYGNSGTTITNQGTITHSFGDGYLYASTFTNQGTITAGASTSLYLGSSSYNTTNASTGTITADGADANLYLRGNMTNLGTLTGQNGGALYLQYNTSTGNLGTVLIGTGGGHAYLGGTLDNTSAILSAPSGGSYELYGGTINNGTIGAGALTFTGSSGTLSNVSYTGDLSLPASTSVTFTNGTSFTGANATFGNFAELYCYQTGTLAGKAITLGTTDDAYITVGNNYSLTLGSDSSVTGGLNVFGDWGSTINNQGTITHRFGTGYINAPILTNSGTITATNGASLTVGSSLTGYNTTNASGGTITADGANTNLYLRGNVINQGTLTAQNGGALYFQYNDSTGNLGTVKIGTGGGHAYLGGILDNTSATLSAPSGGTYELYGGTINNGTIGAGALTFTGSSGTLSNVNYTGDLSLPASTSVTFTNGTSFTGANAAFGNYAGLYWNQTGTLSAKALSLATGSYLYLGASNALTLDSGTTVTGDVQVYTDYSGAAITNQGTITHTSGYGYLYAPTFTNQGTITVSSGTLSLGWEGYAFANTAASSITLTGGSASLLTPLTNAGLLDIQAGTYFYTGGNLTNGLTGIIRGAGTISGGLTVAGGTLSPGNSVGTLTFSSGSFTVTNPATLAIELGGTSCDRLSFSNPSGTVDIGAGLLTLNLNLVGVPTASSYQLISVTSESYGFSGYFYDLPASGNTLSASYLDTPYDFTIQYLSQSVTLNFTPVPEPSTYALLSLGLAGLLLRRLRRRR